jgi:hypothetical protein
VGFTPVGTRPQPPAPSAAIAKYADAGYDEIYVTQIGPDPEGFLRFHEREILQHFHATERVAVG